MTDTQAEYLIELVERLEGWGKSINSICVVILMVIVVIGVISMYERWKL